MVLNNFCVHIFTLFWKLTKKDRALHHSGKAWAGELNSKLGNGQMNSDFPRFRPPLKRLCSADISQNYNTSKWTWTIPPNIVYRGEIKGEWGGGGQRWWRSPRCCSGRPSSTCSAPPSSCPRQCRPAPGGEIQSWPSWEQPVSAPPTLLSSSPSRFHLFCFGQTSHEQLNI